MREDHWGNILKDWQLYSPIFFVVWGGIIPFMYLFGVKEVMTLTPLDLALVLALTLTLLSYPRIVFKGLMGTMLGMSMGYYSGHFFGYYAGNERVKAVMNFMEHFMSRNFVQYVEYLDPKFSGWERVMEHLFEIKEEHNSFIISQLRYFLVWMRKSHRSDSGSGSGSDSGSGSGSGSDSGSASGSGSVPFKNLSACAGDAVIGFLPIYMFMYISKNQDRHMPRIYSTFVLWVAVSAFYVKLSVQLGGYP